MKMARTTKKRRAAGTEATRRWRERRARGRRLLAIEVAEATLARLAGQGLLSITRLDDSVALGAALSRLINSEKFVAGLVSGHAQANIVLAQGIEPGDIVTEDTGTDRSTPGQLTRESHLQTQSRDALGRWRSGISGNPGGKKPGTRNAGSAADQLLRALLGGRGVIRTVGRLSDRPIW
jgi:hypothetical protein